MTNTQPGTPAPAPMAPPAPAAPNVDVGEAQAQAMAAANVAMAQKVANEALRDAANAAREAQSGAPAMGVVRDASGRVVITGRDGRQIVVDPRVVSDEDEVANLVRTALEPPRIPEPPRSGPSEAFLIVSVIMSALVTMLLGFPLVRAYVRRMGTAPAAPSPELAGRLGRIEQAIEAVAIEVERISESERYSARLLTERLPEPAADVRATAEARRGG